MEPAAVKALVAGLLAWISAHTSYAVPGQTPAVAIVPHAYIEALACNGPCEALGVYPDGNIVYIDDALRIDTNVCARSVLLHELVHYLQDRKGRFFNLDPVTRAHAREHEAYAVQKAYLGENGRHIAFGPNFYIGAFTGPAC
jgi:hypothetical protein